MVINSLKKKDLFLFYVMNFSYLYTTIMEDDIFPKTDLQFSALPFSRFRKVI